MTMTFIIIIIIIIIIIGRGIPITAPREVDREGGHSLWTAMAISLEVDCNGLLGI